MKKIFTVILGCLLVTSLVACNSTDDQEDTSNPQVVKEENNISDSGKILVVYFSLPETTDPNTMSEEEENSAIVVDGEVLGNTQYVAQVIHENTDSELFRIEPSVPYPTDHDTLVDQAANEQDENYRPEIKDTIQDFDQYDTIFVGYPNWWGDMPMILYSFFVLVD